MFDRTSFRKHRRLILVATVFIIILVVRGQLSQMDPRWFQLSFPGMKGLTHYLIGNYKSAARVRLWALGSGLTIDLLPASFYRSAHGAQTPCRVLRSVLPRDSAG